MKRKIDDLNRIVLPREMMEALQIQPGGEVEVQRQGEHILISRCVPGCIFCGVAANLVGIGADWVCCGCIERLSQAKKGDVLYASKPR